MPPGALAGRESESHYQLRLFLFLKPQPLTTRSLAAKERERECGREERETGTERWCGWEGGVGREAGSWEG